MGAVSHAYKYSKHIYRKACRNAINGQINKKFKDVDSLFKQKRMGVFWNRIRRSRSSHSISFNSVKIETLETYFKDKFSYDVMTEGDEVQNARTNVENKLKTCKFYYNDFIFSESLMYKYISCLKSGCSPGSDGIMSEHIVNSTVTQVLCFIFVTYLQYVLDMVLSLVNLRMVCWYLF